MTTETSDPLPITEQENPRTANLSSLSVSEIVGLMNDEDALVAAAVGKVLGEIAGAVEGITARLQAGGRLFYIGTGTSGRLGVLDAAECPPTFGVSPDLVQAIIAGGYEACHRAVEASEDDREAGPADLKARGFTRLMCWWASPPRAARHTQLGRSRTRDRSGLSPSPSLVLLDLPLPKCLKSVLFLLLARRWLRVQADSKQVLHRRWF